MKPDWEARRAQRLRREKRERHGILFTVAFCFVTAALCGFFGIIESDRDSHLNTFLTLLSILAAKGFWHWFMNSALIDRLYDDRPQDRDI